ncbi:FGLLP motif-containing membrane protein [Streptomyces sp. NPDC059070]|uniref:FGLLP motif-containing membrane protein n=1 Tax=Streptomyces sp. NPDC059070 TaxID=3346713 RepID=UPI00368C21B4
MSPRPPVTPVLVADPPEVARADGAFVALKGSRFDCATEGPAAAGPLTVSGDVPTGHLRTDAEGGFTYRITLAKNTPLGTYTVVASCDDRPTVTQETTYEVVAATSPPVTAPPPALTLDPASGAPGTKVDVHGKGFVCRGAARVLWDGGELPGIRATPGTDGGLDSSFTVPAGAGAGTYKVTVTCEGAPTATRSVNGTGATAVGAAGGSLAASRTFTVTRPPVTPPPTGRYEITIHMSDYPAECTWGRILVGGKAVLAPWLDGDSAKGDAAPGRWSFIDLHGFIPPELKGTEPVDLDCPGRAVERAGTIDLPAGPFTAFFLPRGTPHDDHEEGPGDRAGVLPRPWIPGLDPSMSPPPPDPTPSGPASPGATPTASSSGGSGAGGPGGATSSPDPDPSEDGRVTGQADGGGHHGRVLGLADSMRTPAEVSWALKDLAGSVGMAAWFLLLVLLLEKAFPSQLVENALGRWWRGRRRERGVRTRAARLPGWLRMGAFALLGGALVVWADATTRWTASTVTKALGAAVGTLLILVVYEKTKDSLLRPGRGGARAELRVVPAGLVLAVLMAALSRFLAFPVPYVYGLVAVYVVLGTEPPGRRDPRFSMPKGQAVMIGGICALSASLLVWAVGAPLIESGRTADPHGLAHVAAYTVGLIVVGGIEVVVFGMLPLTGMDGHELKSWSKPAWYGLYLVALTLFFHVLLHSAHPGFGPGFLVSKDLRWWTLGIATALFAAAWVFSLALRGHVARLERRMAPVG